MFLHYMRKPSKNWNVVPNLGKDFCKWPMTSPQWTFGVHGSHSGGMVQVTHSKLSIKNRELIVNWFIIFSFYKQLIYCSMIVDLLFLLRLWFWGLWIAKGGLSSLYKIKMAHATSLNFCRDTASDNFRKISNRVPHFYYFADASISFFEITFLWK